VTANIAEGNGRWYYKENIQFCRKSRGSLKEVLEHLIVSFDERYVNETQLLEYKVKQERCIQLLNGYIRYLKKAKPVKDEES
jgi:four helix bundle protein